MIFLGCLASEQEDHENTKGSEIPSLHRVQRAWSQKKEATFHLKAPESARKIGVVQRGPRLDAAGPLQKEQHVLPQLRALPEIDRKIERAAQLGVAQNSRARVTQVIVFGSIYQGASLAITCFLSHCQLPKASRRNRTAGIEHGHSCNSCPTKQEVVT